MPKLEDDGCVGLIAIALHAHSNQKRKKATIIVCI